MSDPFLCVGVQFDIAWEDKAANFATVRRLLAAAPPEKHSLVVLPEMFATGFSMNTALVAENPGGETGQFLARTAKEFGVCLVAGVAARGSDGHPRNTALAFSPDGNALASYAKMHPFTPGGEADHYTPGEHPVAFRWNGCTVSPFACYDVRFPEVFRAAVTAHRTELIVVIANFPEKRILHWVRLLQARAIENQACVIGVNRIGRDPYYTYNGRSIIVDPNGDILADAGSREGCISARLDLAGLRKYREGLPFLADMKSRAPKAITSSE